ncbi:MAG: hypothetical protein PSV16_14980 [Flavobacterium sp.]|nr:hypothetical protein [Flavobacterium sp.]
MSTQKINISSELMQNFKQAEIMSPENKFEALQTDKGLSLLFSIGTDGVLYLTSELDRHETGWEKKDLSTACTLQDFPAQTGVYCKTFEVSQSASDATISLAMVLSDGNGDHLYLSLGNSASDMTWIDNPQWTTYPYDYQGSTSSVTVTNVLISNTSANKQFIAVDIIRAGSTAFISRYFIDVQKTSGNAWHEQNLSIDLDAAHYQSCLGRQYLSDSPHQPTIDGLYTSGSVDGSPQFIFQPLYDTADSKKGPAPVTRLKLPGGLVADSMASCRKTDLSTDLYVCSQGGLYFFAAANQGQEATAELILKNPMFNGVKKMYAAQSDGIVTVWGLDESNQIFYLTCTIGQEESPDAWSFPIPIVSGVDLFSPYLNRVDNGNTFFAVAGNYMKRMYKSPKNKMWKSQNILFPTLDSDNTNQFTSYTTQIQVTDEYNQPLADSNIHISVDSRVGVYVNHLYYNLDTAGADFKTDALGTITVLEWIDGIVGTKLNITASDGTSVLVNPMDKPVGKVTVLDSPEALQQATVTSEDGTSKPLVSSSVSTDDLNSVAQSNANLGQAYASFSPGSTTQTMKKSTSAKQSVVQLGVVNTIVVDAGDLFSWLETGVEAVIEVIEDEVQAVWNFVATIAGQVYTAVLDCVEAVVGAIQWVFNVIQTALADLVQFLQFLFGWQDILTTHMVLKNFFTQSAQMSINNLSESKAAISRLLEMAEGAVGQWADIPPIDDSPNTTTAAAQPLPGQSTSPSNLGVYHYQGNTAAAAITYTPIALGADIFNDLMDALNGAEDILKDTYVKIQKDIIEPFRTLSLSEIIKRFVGILAQDVLEAADVIIGEIINVLIQLTASVMTIITAEIDIPVLSWLYKKLTGEALSCIDLVCLISAIPATIVYKLTTGAAPFVKGTAFTDALLSAKSFADIRNAFKLPSANKSAKKSAKLSRTTEATGELFDQDTLDLWAFITGILAAAGACVLAISTTAQKIADDVKFKKIALTMAAISAVANLCYVSPNYAGYFNTDPDWYVGLNDILTEISVAKAFAFIQIAGADSDTLSWMAAGAECVLNIVWFVPVGMTVYDGCKSEDTDWLSLIPATIGNSAFNLGGIMDPIVIAAKGVTAKSVSIGLQLGFVISYGICMPVAGSFQYFD